MRTCTSNKPPGKHLGSRFRVWALRARIGFVVSGTELNLQLRDRRKEPRSNFTKRQNTAEPRRSPAPELRHSEHIAGRGASLAEPRQGQQGSAGLNSCSRLEDLGTCIGKRRHCRFDIGTYGLMFLWQPVARDSVFGFPDLRPLA